VKGDIGSFDFFLEKKSMQDLDYSLPQSVIVSVEQNSQILFRQVIKNLNLKEHIHIDFVYENLYDAVELIIESAVKKDQFNKDNPIELTDLVVDDMFGAKSLTFNMKLVVDQNIVDIGNTLYQTGKLIGVFKLPIIKYQILSTI